MKSLAAFFLWSTLLTVPCAFVSTRWCELLWIATNRLLDAAGVPADPIEVVRFAPFDLALFAGMVLASARAPWRRRRMALLAGLPAIVLGELATLLASMGLARLASYGALDAATTRKLIAIPAYTAIYAIPLLGWALAVGRWYLPMSPPITSPRKR